MEDQVPVSPEHKVRRTTTVEVYVKGHCPMCQLPLERIFLSFNGDQFGDYECSCGRYIYVPMA